MDIKSIQSVRMEAIKANMKKHENVSKKEKEHTEKAEQKKTDPAAVYEHVDPSKTVESGYGIPSTQHPRLSEIDKMKLEMDRRMNGAFYRMVLDALDGQNMGMKQAIELLMKERGEEITPEMVEEAEQSVSESGYFGVQATADRILDFAKHLAVDDPEKAEQLKAAFEAGFKEAEKIWGGELPEISKKTYQAVMEGFDQWMNPDEQGGAQDSDADAEDA